MRCTPCKRNSRSTHSRNLEKPMTSSERLAEEQNAPSACAKCRAQQPHLLSQRILGMLPRTAKERSKKHLRTTKNDSKKAAQRPSQSKEAYQYLPRQKKKRSLLTGTPVRLAKGTPNGLPERLREQPQPLQDASKVLRRGVLEAKTQKT